jgi:hypothetical protein
VIDMFACYGRCGDGRQGTGTSTARRCIRTRRRLVRKRPVNHTLLLQLRIFDFRVALRVARLVLL